MQIHRIGDVSVLNDYAEVPGLGFLPVNAYVLHAEQPVVIDTGLSTVDKDFVSPLAEVLDPADVRWLWITHPDRDHTGGLWPLLEAAPRARLVTTFLGVGIMSTEWPVPLDRVFLLNPGQALDVGDRRLHAFRPPLFDNPSTTGFLDDRSGALFSSDCFGAPMPSLELATSGDVRAVGDAVRDLQLLWASVDSPWVHQVDPAKFRATVDPVRAMGASAVFSTHLPPATQLDDRLYETVLLRRRHLRSSDRIRRHSRRCSPPSSPPEQGGCARGRGAGRFKPPLPLKEDARIRRSTAPSSIVCR